MIDLIKPYLTYISLIIIAGILTYSHMKAYQSGEDSIQVKFDSYKDNINDQVQKAKNEKERIESENRAATKLAGDNYNRDIRRLANELERLRNTKAMPREQSMSMARSSESTMSRTEENTTRTAETIEITTGTRQTSFYRAAMMDTLQCSRLIEFIK